MKGIMLIGIALLISGCSFFSRDTEVIEYRKVSVSPVIEPVPVGYVEPIDVTTTTIDFY